MDNFNNHFDPKLMDSKTGRGEKQIRVQMRDNSEYVFSHQFDEIKNLTMVGKISSAKMQIGENIFIPLVSQTQEQNQDTNSFFNKTPFPLHLAPYQFIKLVIQAEGSADLYFTGVWLPFEEKQQSEFVCHWNGVEYKFTGGACERV